MTYVSGRYAMALYESGCDATLFAQAVDFVLGCQPLWEALRSPVIPFSEKKAVLEALPPFSEHANLLRFFLLLVERRRIALLADIAKEYHLLVLHSEQVTECVMTCVTIPDKARQDRLCQTLCRLHKKPNIHLVFQIDLSLIGGFLLEIDGILYDQSIRGKLRGLSRYMEEVNAL